MENDFEYSYCRNCGKYFITSQGFTEQFCSKECATPYHRCRNCGKYFIKERVESSDFCSNECSTQYITKRETKL